MGPDTSTSTFNNGAPLSQDQINSIRQNAGINMNPHMAGTNTSFDSFKSILNSFSKSWQQSD